MANQTGEVMYLGLLAVHGGQSRIVSFSTIVTCKCIIRMGIGSDSAWYP